MARNQNKLLSPLWLACLLAQLLVKYESDLLSQEVRTANKSLCLHFGVVPTRHAISYLCVFAHFFQGFHAVAGVRRWLLAGQVESSGAT